MSISNYDTGFPNGVTIRGIPLIDIQNSAGQVFWVDSNYYQSGDANRGTFTSPLKTLQAAIDKCRPNEGDKIFVAAGHVEILEEIIEVNVIGVQIIGLGNKNNRPYFGFKDPTVGFYVIADNVYIVNIRLEGLTSYDPGPAIDCLLSIEAKNGYYENLFFETQSSSVGANNFVKVPHDKFHNADGTTFSCCEFLDGSIGVMTPSMNAGILLAGPINNLTIHQCNIMGKFAKGCIGNDFLMGDDFSDNILITGEGYFINKLYDSQYKVIDAVGVIGGYISRNMNFQTYTVDQPEILTTGRFSRGINGDVEYQIHNIPFGQIHTFGTVLMGGVVGAYAVENIILEVGVNPITVASTISIEKSDEGNDKGNPIFFSIPTTGNLDSPHVTIDMSAPAATVNRGTVTTAARVKIISSASLAAVTGALRITIKLRKIKDSTYYAI